MRAGVQIRTDYSAGDLRRIARQSGDADQTRRLLALAVILDGGSRSEAARTGGVGLQVVRDWVLRFNAGGPESLKTRKAPGKAPILSDGQRAQLAGVVETGPKPYLDGVVRWRLVDLVQWVWDEFGVTLSRQTLGRELRRMGFRKLSARPQHHAQDPDAIEAFKKTSPTWSPTSASATAGRR
jgi:transposase